MQRTKEPGNQIIGIHYCRECLKEKPEGEDLVAWQRVVFGVTKDGLQLFCVRHKVSVIRVIDEEMVTVRPNENH